MTDQVEPEPYRLAASPSHLLHRAEQLAAERFAQLVGGAITLRQFAVLAAISQSPGLTQSELVRQTGVDRSTLADMLARMQERGWITRATHALDQRAQSVRLADEGASILAAATKHARAADAAILDALPRAKRRAFINLLTRLDEHAAEIAAKQERDLKRQARTRAKARGKDPKPKTRRARARD